MSAPTLGVVVTAHNQNDTLPDCIGSIVRERVPKVVVVVDDGSDPPVPRLAWHQSEVVALSRRSRPFGVQKARNAGWRAVMRHAPRFILFCDGDIVWHPHSIDKMVYALETTEAAFAYGGYRRGGVLRGECASRIWDADALKVDNYISTMSVVRAEVLPDPPFIEDEERYQDWSLWLRLLNAGHFGHFVGSPLFTAYYDEGDISVRGHEDLAKWREIIRGRYVE